MSSQLANPITALKIVNQWTRVFYTCFKYHAVRRVADLVDPPEGPIVQEVSRLLGRALVKQLGLQVTVRGMEHTENLRRYCVAATHASYLDWCLILAYFPTAVRFVAREEITKFPVVGAYLKQQAVLIDRSKGAEARKKLGAAVERAMTKDDRYPVLIFPEGTRTPDGQIQKFRRGGLGLLMERGLKALPLAIRGSYESLPRHAMYIEHAYPITITACAPVDPADYPDIPAAIAETERRAREAWAQR